MSLTQILTTDSVSASTVNTKIVDPANAHINDTVVHVTTGDKTEWNGKAELYPFTSTITTSWSGSNPYYQTVTINGVLSTDKPIIDVVMSGTYAADVSYSENWSKIYRITTGTNSITVYATEATTVTLPIQLMVVR